MPSYIIAIITIVILAGAAALGVYFKPAPPTPLPAPSPVEEISPIPSPSPEITPEPIPFPIESPTPSPAPKTSLTPKISPRPSPRVSPSPSPTVPIATFIPSPIPSPAITLSPTPAPTPTPTPQAKREPQRFIVVIENNKFNPDILEIRSGDTVRWLNQDPLSRWPASDPNPTHTGYPGFDALGDLLQDEWWEFRFEKIGRWPYHDHSGISRPGGEEAGPFGTIIVIE